MLSISTRLISSAFVAVLLVALGGCSSESPSATEPGPPEDISQAQELALSDGQVSKSEYLEGFRRYATCLLDAGFTIVENGEARGVLNYSVPAEAVDSGDDQRCYVLEFKQVDIAWQIANPEPTILNDIMVACLAAAGIDAHGTDSELEQRLAEEGLDLDACIEEHGPQND